MAVTIKSPKEIDLMREAGRRLEIVHKKLGEFVKPGISTKDIDRYGAVSYTHLTLPTT